MITIEMIDELRARVDVTYEDAKEALENSQGDILEAIIYLERNNKINSKKEEFKEEQKEEQDGFTKAVCKVISWSKNVFRKGNSNHLTIMKNDNVILRLPLTVVVLVVVLAPYISIPLLLLALFSGHKIRFNGDDIEKTRANDTMDKVSNAAENIKSEFAK
jgi:Translation elongation factor Ts